ncbi:hypothetical protein C8R41DRAFT_339863 [Lentinula lateritia]|uniref:Uncharacterized protein n=1 Tax=Lentinula lateritia TaxID=40482 RepID=A0ABQ8VGB5_9AGAR|nr:hypothetical protein C8R41DRAFT_339863 [Lentinula lateritia]
MPNNVAIFPKLIASCTSLLYPCLLSIVLISLLFVRVYIALVTHFGLVQSTEHIFLFSSRSTCYHQVFIPRIPLAYIAIHCTVCMVNQDLPKRI